MPNRMPLLPQIKRPENGMRIGNSTAIIVLAVFAVGLFCSVAGISYAVAVTMKALGL